MQQAAQQESEQFWQEFESRTGETVVHRCMGCWHPVASDSQGQWGLIILTNNSFHYQYLPSDNWLLSLLRMGKKNMQTKKAMEIVVPLSCVTAIEIPRRSLLMRIFGSNLHRFYISWQEGESTKKEIFSADPKEALVKALGNLEYKS